MAAVWGLSTPASGAPTLVISERTGLGWRYASLLGSPELVADEKHDQDEGDGQADKERDNDGEAEQPFGHSRRQGRELGHGGNGSGSMGSRLR